ncbi:family 47 putative glycoside hydrolase [Podospora australis]|uniref:alpha-1,2-Mannosidase n=1 Tax=Podospora australis TaxID=1536484 RepID=A0AAN7AJN6_9PEZI|nr:family 47 putative glycoside hydrolase [Podospora australis]
MAILTARRFQRLTLLTVVVLALYYFFGVEHDPLHSPIYKAKPNTRPPKQTSPTSTTSSEKFQAWKFVPSSYNWGKRAFKHPFDKSEAVELPKGTPHELPRIQHEFTEDELTASHNKTQSSRRNAVREAAKKSWGAYRKYAWGKDELMPEQLKAADTFAGWGATLVDSLDTLWIMDLKPEFDEAVRLVGTIDWDRTTGSRCSLFETTIRYLGGLLSAYDLSGEKILLDKAIEIGDMMYAGFDTENHMPVNSFEFGQAKAGTLRVSASESSAAAGTLSLEFTRLSQLTGDMKYYNAIDGVTREMEKSQDKSNIPGMWPVFVNLQVGFGASGTSFTLGASADSAYEYLSKMYALLGGLEPTYKKLHTKAMAAAKKYLLFRPMLPEKSPDVLFSGTVYATKDGPKDIQPQVQHLACFAGGMFALGGKLFGEEDDVRVGEQLARGCAWAYEAFPSGVMPEVSDLYACPKEKDDDEKEEGEAFAHCKWDEVLVSERAKKLPKGFASITDSSYLLRPEAIESVFILYRITGKKDLLDIAWNMFSAVKKATETKHAHSSIMDVNVEAGASRTKDSMESFWIAETLKYFYLIFSEPDLISLDDYVFNTEAHPLRLPKPGSKLLQKQDDE